MNDQTAELIYGGAAVLVIAALTVLGAVVWAALTTLRKRARR